MVHIPRLLYTQMLAVESVLIVRIGKALASPELLMCLDFKRLIL
jgi:hypothetical protein